MMQTTWSAPDGSGHARLAFGLMACGLSAENANRLAIGREHTRAIRTILFHVRTRTVDDDVDDDDDDDHGDDGGGGG